MQLKYRTEEKAENDIDVTSFMNLMIVLVPVLLLNMTFSQLAVLEIKLPELSGGKSLSKDPQSELEVEISPDGYRVYFPSGQLQKMIPKAKPKPIAQRIDSDKTAAAIPELAYDNLQLSMVLRTLKNQIPEKKDLLIRSTPNIKYEHLIQLVDTVKSYKTVLALSVVEIELFPEISIDDARRRKKG